MENMRPILKSEALNVMDLSIKFSVSISKKAFFKVIGNVLSVLAINEIISLIFEKTYEEGIYYLLGVFNEK